MSQSTIHQYVGLDVSLKETSICVIDDEAEQVLDLWTVDVLGPAPLELFEVLSTANPAEFATIRERLIKIGARVIEHIARIRIQLPTSCPEGPLFRAVAFGLMPSGP